MDYSVYNSAPLRFCEWEAKAPTLLTLAGFIRRLAMCSAVEKNKNSRHATPSAQWI